MSLVLSVDSEGRKFQERFEGIATISENPLLLTLMTTDAVWKELMDKLDRSIISAIALESIDSMKDEKSILYLRDDEGRERLNEYKFEEDYPASDIVRAGTNVETSIIRSDQVKKAMPIKWKWEGSRHSD